MNQFLLGWLAMGMFVVGYITRMLQDRFWPEHAPTYLQVKATDKGAVVSISFRDGRPIAFSDLDATQTKAFKELVANLPDPE